MTEDVSAESAKSEARVRASGGGGALAAPSKRLFS
jgi:hypothetical protein